MRVVDVGVGAWLLLAPGRLHSCARDTKNGRRGRGKEKAQKEVRQMRVPMKIILRRGREGMRAGRVMMTSLITVRPARIKGYL